MLLILPCKNWNLRKGTKKLKMILYSEIKKYEVSIIYGPKIILASETIFHYIKLYICYLRPILVNNKHRLNRERYLFMSSKSDAEGAKPVQLQHTTLRTYLTKTCERAGVFKQTEEGAQKRMSCS